MEPKVYKLDSPSEQEVLDNIARLKSEGASEGLIAYWESFLEAKRIVAEIGPKAALKLAKQRIDQMCGIGGEESN